MKEQNHCEYKNDMENVNIKEDSKKVGEEI